MVWFYQHSEDQAGFHYDGSAWTQFGPPLSGDPTEGGYTVTAVASVEAAPQQVYAVQDGTNVLSISSDGGLTWTQRTITGLATFPKPQIYSVWAPVVGEVYLLESRGTPAMDGIWRSLDDGVTWTRIVPLSLGLNTIGDHMGVGVSKFFYAECTALASGSRTWAFRRCNFDGSGIETWATQTFTGSGTLPFGILLRAISDDFVLATNYAGLFVWRIDAGGITDVRPGGLNFPWDALPLSVTDWLAVGTATDIASLMNVQVYRTTNAGTSWTLTTTIPVLQGFARNGRANSYFMINAPQPSSPSDVVMLGHADYNVQQIFWSSSDGGVSWTPLLNAADPVDTGGDWTVYGPGGLASVCSVVPQVAVPSRLATIVG